MKNIRYHLKPTITPRTSIYSNKKNIKKKVESQALEVKIGQKRIISFKSLHIYRFFFSIFAPKSICEFLIHDHYLKVK